MRAALKPETEIGFHGHHNLSMGVSNSIAAIAAGANRIDAACAGLGAGAGNTPMEVLVAVCDRMGIDTGVSVFGIQDVAEDLVVPIMDFPIRSDRDALTMGYAGSTVRSCCSPSAPRRSTAFPRGKSSSRWGAAEWSAARKT